MLSVSSIQHQVLQRAGQEWFRRMGADVSFDGIAFRFPDKVDFTNLCVYDQRRDTLLFVTELVARLDLFSISGKEIRFSRILLQEPDIRLRMDSTRTFNSQFLLDAFKSPKKSSDGNKWALNFRDIEINNARLCIQTRPDSQFRVTSPGAIDFSNLSVTGLSLHINHLTLPDSGGVAFRIQKLSLREQSGFEIVHLSSGVLIHPRQILCDHLVLITPATTLAADDCGLRFPSFKSLGEAFITDVRMSLHMERSTIALKDIGYFVPLFRPYPESVSFSGQVEGTVRDLKARDIVLRVGQSTVLRADMEWSGLPDWRKTRFTLDFRELSTTPADLRRVRLPRQPQEFMKLPEPATRFTSISYTGTFIGYLDNFVTHGRVTSNLGSLVTDMSIRPVISVRSDTTFMYSGTLETRQFQLGRLLDQPYLGGVTMKGSVQGSATRRGDVKAQVQGVINSLMIRDYEYQNIVLNGTVDNQTYNGSLTVQDENLEMDFLGTVDLSSGRVPRLQFSAAVGRARLNKLNLARQDTSAFASFQITGDFTGAGIDQLQGEMSLEDVVLTMAQKTLKVNDVLLFTKQIDSINRFILRSDILHAEVWGKYEFLKLPLSFTAMLKQYIPSLVAPSVSADSLSHNNFRFDMEFVDTDQLTNFLTDEFFIAEGSRMEGVYDPYHRNVSLELRIPYIDLSGKRWSNLLATGKTSEQGFVMDVSCSGFDLNDRIPLQNIRGRAVARNDSVWTDFSWRASEHPELNAGRVGALIHFLPDSVHQANKVLISPSDVAGVNTLVVNGSQWQLSFRDAVLDSSSVAIRDLLLRSDRQQISVNGRMSRVPGEQLRIGVQNLDLSLLSGILKLRHLSVEGIANGASVLGDVFDQLYFTSDLTVDRFALNGQALGTLSAKTSWKDREREVDVQLSSRRDSVSVLDVSGIYGVGSGTLDLGIRLNSCPLEIAAPYVSGVFSRFSGGVSGQLRMTGPAKASILDGQLNLQDVVLTPVFTNSEYHISGVVPVVGNQLQFSRVAVTDRMNNQATLAGTIQNASFRNLIFALTLNTRRLEVLNTAQGDNDILYGSGFAGGTVRINGNISNLTLDMELTTGRNSRFYIPLESSATVSGNSLISFVQPVVVSRGVQKQNPFRRQPTAGSVAPRKQPGVFTLKLVLHATPEAETQLVFDPTIGDIMQGSGTGTLRFDYRTNSPFSMVGTFTVEQGKYESQFKRLLASKEFSIDKGGIISWDGDPMGAQIDVRAVYRARPPLSSLLRDQSATGNVDVDCILRVTNTLSDPVLSFDLAMPNARQEVRAYLSGLTSTEEEIMRQFTYLLAFNSFYSDAGSGSQGQLGGMADMDLGAMSIGTFSEFISGQFSRMASQLIENVDLGVRYRPGTDFTGQDVEIDVTSGRVHFTGNVGVGSNRLEKSDNVRGDFSMDVSITRDGRLRLKAYNRSNDSYLFEQAPFTQGIGLMYRREFNRFSELFLRKPKPIPLPPLSGFPPLSTPADTLSPKL
jgi:hypothetical protein